MSHDRNTPSAILINAAQETMPHLIIAALTRQLCVFGGATMPKSRIFCFPTDSRSPDKTTATPLISFARASKDKDSTDNAMAIATHGHFLASDIRRFFCSEIHAFSILYMFSNRFATSTITTRRYICFTNYALCMAVNIIQRGYMATKRTKNGRFGGHTNRLPHIRKPTKFIPTKIYLH